MADVSTFEAQSKIVLTQWLSSNLQADFLAVANDLIGRTKSPLQKFLELHQRVRILSAMHDGVIAYMTTVDDEGNTCNILEDVDIANLQRDIPKLDKLTEDLKALRRECVRLYGDHLDLTSQGAIEIVRVQRINRVKEGLFFSIAGYKDRADEKKTHSSSSSERAHDNTALGKIAADITRQIGDLAALVHAAADRARIKGLTASALVEAEFPMQLLSTQESKYTANVVPSVIPSGHKEAQLESIRKDWTLTMKRRAVDVFETRQRYIEELVIIKGNMRNFIQYYEQQLQSLQSELGLSDDLFRTSFKSRQPVEVAGLAGMPRYSSALVSPLEVLAARALIVKRIKCIGRLLIDAVERFEPYLGDDGGAAGLVLQPRNGMDQRVESDSDCLYASEEEEAVPVRDDNLYLSD